MANLITVNDFKGELDIPTNNVGISNNLNVFITKYEKKFKDAVWGEEDMPSEIVDRLRNAIACYVYFKWMNDKTSFTTGVGVSTTKTENSVQINPAFKSTRAIRECREDLDNYYCFIRNNGTYPNWDRRKFINFYQDEISGINVFNI